MCQRVQSEVIMECVDYRSCYTQAATSRAADGHGNMYKANSSWNVLIAGPATPKQQPAELLMGMEGMSARERNQAKRKAKAMAKAESSGARGGLMQ